MAFGRKPAEEIVKQETKIWECSSDDCNAWIRDNFRSDNEEKPACPICKSEMTESERVLEVLHNSSRK